MLKGQLLEQGTHDELLAAGGHYAEMYSAGVASGEDYIKEPSEGTTTVETEGSQPPTDVELDREDASEKQLV